MRRLMIGLTLVGMAALIPLWVRADDRQIAQEIVQQLQKHKDTGELKGFGIDLQVEQGVVRLEGRVSTASQQRLALDTVRRVEGVKQVVNKLAVTGKPFSQNQAAANKPVAKGAYNASLAKLKGALNLNQGTPATLTSAQSEADAAAKLAEKDQEIARQVAGALKSQKENGNLKGFRVNLSVDRGTVWLEGDVASRDQRLMVLDAARRIPGVKQVVNELEVRKQDPALLVSQTTEAASQPAAAPQAAPIPVAEVAPEVTPIPVAETKPAPIAEAAPQVIPEAVVAAKPAAPAAAVGTAVAPQQPQGLVAAPAAQLAQVPAAYQQAGQPVPMTYVAQVQPPAYVPGHAASVPSPVARTRYDHPQVPSYAWPTYASHPNYAAVTYPKQYSPTAWPYIGPFYPYPQVPLGWRKVTLEWDDGWWQLDFKNRR